MIPVGLPLPHGVNPAPPAPLAEPLPVVGPVGAQAVVLDVHAPRAASVPVGAPDARSTRVRQEPPPVPDGAGGVPADAAGGAAGNRAAAVAAPLQSLLRMLQQLGVGPDPAGASHAVAWPAGPMPLAADPVSALQALRQALGQSPWLAPRPRPLAAPAGTVVPAPGGGLPGLAAGATAAPPAAAEPEGAAPPATADQQGMALPAGPGAASLATADGLQQALQLLLHGQLRWSGELTPGVRCQLQREDVWEEDPQHPGRLVAGTAIRVVLDLPATGTLEAQAQQVGERLRVRLLPAAGQARCFEDGLGELRAALLPLAAQPVDLAVRGRAGPDA